MSKDKTFAALAILRDVHDTLASESDSDIDHFEDDDEEREGAPVQYAARKVMEVMDMLKAGTSAPGTPEAPAATFKLGDQVRKTKGSQWRGRVVGTYSTALTPEGYAVESSTERGSVQIYPAAALEIAESPAQLDGGQEGSESNG